MVSNGIFFFKFFLGQLVSNGCFSGRFYQQHQKRSQTIWNVKQSSVWCKTELALLTSIVKNLCALLISDSSQNVRTLPNLMMSHSKIFSKRHFSLFYNNNIILFFSSCESFFVWLGLFCLKPASLNACLISSNSIG